MILTFDVQLCRSVALLGFGDSGIWRFGNLEIREFGDSGIWRFGESVDSNDMTDL
jgi:hypothetical protein